MNNPPTQEDIYWQLLQLALRSRHDFARLAEKEYGLTGAQLHTLCVIRPDSPVPMNTLSCQMACDASNITGIVDRLSAQGYMERKDDPADRRVKMVALTAKGVRLRERALAELVTLVPAGIAYLSADEERQLQILLAKALLPFRQP